MASGVMVSRCDGYDAGDLAIESFDEPEVAAGDMDIRDDGFGIAG